MLKTAIAQSIRESSGHTITATDTQRVMVVNGCMGILEVVETVLHAGHYDVVFVESNEHAYSQVKRLQPDLVILCIRIDRLDGFHVLSMLKLDPETRDIPVLTYTITDPGRDAEEEAAEPIDTGIFTQKPVAELMN
jgi:CheY-like chemotaxis protein